MVITRAATLGCGTIGASWAANFLARGLDVAASDPAPSPMTPTRFRDGYAAKTLPAGPVRW